MKWTLPTKRGLSLNLSLFCLFGLMMVLSTCGTPSPRTAASALPTPRPDPSPSVHATCRTEQLRLALDQDVSELGNAGLQLTFENASRESCTLAGYPALQLLDTHHKQLPMKIARSTYEYLYHMHDPQVIALQPGKKAYVGLLGPPRKFTTLSDSALKPFHHGQTRATNVPKMTRRDALALPSLQRPPHLIPTYLGSSNWQTIERK